MKTKVSVQNIQYEQDGYKLNRIQHFQTIKTASRVGTDYSYTMACCINKHQHSLSCDCICLHYAGICSSIHDKSAAVWLSIFYPTVRRPACLTDWQQIIQLQDSNRARLAQTYFEHVDKAETTTVPYADCSVIGCCNDEAVIATPRYHSHFELANTVCQHITLIATRTHNS